MLWCFLSLFAPSSSLHPLFYSYLFLSLFFFPFLSSLCLSFSHFYLPTLPLLFSATLLHFMACRWAALLLWLCSFFFFCPVQLLLVKLDKMNNFGKGHGHSWQFWQDVLHQVLTSSLTKLKHDGNIIANVKKVFDNIRSFTWWLHKQSFMILEICLSS